MVKYKSELKCELLISCSKYNEFWYKYLKYLMEKLYIHLTKLIIASFYFYNSNIKQITKNS